MSFLKDIFFETKEVADPKISTDPNRPLASQLSDDHKHLFNAIPPENTGPAITPSFTGNIITAEDADKYKAYFGNLIDGLKLTKPGYHEFINMVEAMPATIPDDVKMTSVFGGMKKMDLTKDVLLSTVTDTINALKSDREDFVKNANGKFAETVEAKRDTIKNMQAEILKLQTQMQQLQTEAADAEAKINHSVSAYNAFSTQVQAKVQNDLDKISTYIQ